MVFSVIHRLFLQIGRMVYELAQTYRLDAYMSFVSLDKNYYFTEGEPHYRVAVMNNTGPRTIDFKVSYAVILSFSKYKLWISRVFKNIKFMLQLGILKMFEYVIGNHAVFFLFFFL